MRIQQKTFKFFVLVAYFKATLAVTASVFYDNSDLSSQILVINSLMFAVSHAYSNSTYGLGIYSLNDTSDIKQYQIDSLCTNLTSIDYLQGTFLMLTQTALYYLDYQQNPLSFSNKYTLSRQVTSINNAEGTKVILGYVDGTIQIIDFFNNTFQSQLNGCTGQTFSVSYILFDNNIVGLCKNMLISWDKTVFNISGTTKVFSPQTTLNVSLNNRNTNFLFSFGQGANRRFMVGIISNNIQAYQLSSNIFSTDSSISPISISGQSQTTYFRQQQNLIYWRTLTNIIIYRYKISTVTDNLTPGAQCSPNISSIFSDSLDFIINCNMIGNSNQYSIQKISFVPLICNPGCASCSSSGPPYNCSTCDTQNNFQLNSSGQCVCINNYYLDTLKGQCISCPIQCNGCQILSGQLQCLACNSSIASSDYRQPFNQNTLCSCQDRYYDDSTLTCKPCDITCLTCTDNQSTSCKSCNSSTDHRQFDSTNKTCDCSLYFTESSPKKQQCASCHPTCLTCNGVSPQQCLTCDSSKNRKSTANNSCQCIDGFYEDSSYNCIPCHITCQTCSGGSENDCISCNSSNYRAQNQTKCLCSPGYTENSPITSSCQQCHYSCLTCFGPNSNQCNSCDVQNKRQLQNGTCNCIQNYYDKGIAQCDACHLTCESCIGGNTNTNCQSCSQNSFRHLSNSQCVCNKGYIEYIPQQQSCQCDANQNRILNSKGQCVCQYGYYEDSTQNCIKCHYSCQTCFGGSSNQCLTCENQYQRFLINNICNCLDNYFENGVSQCQKCNNPKCKICDKNTQACLGCYDSQNRYLDKQGICSCKSGYNDDQNNISNICFLKCIENCETCMPSNLQSCLQCNQYFSYNQNTSKCTRDLIPSGIPDGKVQDISKYSGISSYISIAVSTTSSIALSFVSSNDRIFKALFTLQKINFLLLINFPFPQILYQFQKSISGTTPITLLNQINIYPYIFNENEEQYSGPLQDGKFKSEQIKTSIIYNAGGMIPVLIAYLLLLLISVIAYKKQQQKDLEFQNRFKGLCLPIYMYIQQNKQGIFIKLLNKLLGFLTLQIHEFLSIVFVFSITLQILSYTYNTIDSEISMVILKSIFFCVLFVYSIGSFLYYANFINQFFLLKQREEISSNKTLIEMNYSFLINPSSQKDQDKLTAQIDPALPDIIFQSYLQDYIKILFFTRNFIFINDTVELIIIPLCIIAPFQNCFTQIILCLIFQSLLCLFILIRRPSKLILKNIELFLQNIIWVFIFICYLILAYQIKYKIDLNNLNNSDQQMINIISIIIMILCLFQILIIPFFTIASLIKQFPNIIKKLRQKIKKQDKESEDIIDSKKSNLDILPNQSKSLLESIVYNNPKQTLSKSIIQMTSFKHQKSNAKQAKINPSDSQEKPQIFK
ncbi:hypothetical protein ABPG72_019180 [Tetrahymena utriculariae]